MNTTQFKLNSTRIDSPTATHTLSHELDELNWQVDSSAAIVELLHRVATANSLDDAHLIVVNELSRFLQADRIAIGVTSNQSARVTVKAVSDIAQTDPTSDQMTWWSDAMSEAIVRYREINANLTMVDSSTAKFELMTLAHQRLMSHTASQVAWSCPLVSDDGSIVGVWTARFAHSPEHTERITRFASAITVPLAEALRVSQRVDEGVVARVRRSITQGNHASRTKRIGIGAATMLVLALIPIPHRISCFSTIQPTSQRFAVVPHDGILKQVHVEAGDLVAPGELLAEMDATEIELEIADLLARQERVQKKADVHQAEDDPTATQLARLEASELAAQADLLRYRLSRQQMVSPIAGLVLQCELDDATGAPVRTGDILMQIASLDSLRGELEIQEADFSHISIGQEVQLVADGQPLDPINARVEKIRPMSEVRNGQNVFVAEVTIENRDRTLRPGMQAHSKISAGYRPAGWVFLHRAFERAYGSLR